MTQSYQLIVLQIVVITVIMLINYLSKNINYYNYLVKNIKA